MNDCQSELKEVFVDDREPEHFLELFRAAGAVKVSRVRLKVGDFEVNRRWVFERKTITDLCMSLIDGRLFSQTLRMLQTDKHQVMILQGSTSDAASVNVSREALSGALITINVFFNIPIMRAINEAEVVKLIKYTVIQGRRYSKEGVHRHGYRPKKIERQKLFLLQGLPGIGYKRAVALLEHFGSVGNIMRADEDSLAAVKGIGKETAHRICQILR